MKREIRTEEDLTKLQGQSESFRLEFKSSLLLEKSRDEIRDNLSREVSAFANSEGGEIVLGIREKKEGKTRVAEDIDEGVDPKKVAPEWLQQIVGSNVSPHLPGIKLHKIALSGAKQGRVAYVISVPRGSTAYQASDKRYYGRSEYEAQALPDHEIRLRMMRGRIAQARL